MQNSVTIGEQTNHGKFKTWKNCREKQIHTVVVW